MMITQALASGAPQEVIDELLKRYNEAMQRYVAAMAANPPAPGQQPMSPDAKELGMDDVQTLLKLIQNCRRRATAKRRHSFWRCCNPCWKTCA
jgi:hypothetical protein